MSQKEEKGIESSRRRFLKSATKIAVYTPPVMFAASVPSLESIAQSAGADIYPGSKKSKKKSSKKKSSKKKSKKK